MRIEDLLESFDSYYDYDKRVNKIGSITSESYSIYVPDVKTGSDKAYTVTINHDPNEDMAEHKTEVFFQDQHGRMNITGDSGFNVMRLFSTIFKIIKESPVVRSGRGFVFSANKREGSRVKLYQRFLQSQRVNYTRVDDPDDEVFVVKL